MTRNMIMAKHSVNKTYAFKDKVEHSIDEFASKSNPTIYDLMNVRVVGQIEKQLDVFRAEAKNMTVGELEDERHRSKELAAFMTMTGDPKPHKECHAHAIISGGHKEAAELRAILAFQKIRIDDPDNGCWLPRNTAAKAVMPKRLKEAVPHSRIHRFNYYFWLNRIISLTLTSSPKKLRNTLNTVELRLQSGRQPDWVMNKKGKGLPL